MVTSDRRKTQSFVCLSSTLGIFSWNNPFPNDNFTPKRRVRKTAHYPILNFAVNPPAKDLIHPNNIGNLDIHFGGTVHKATHHLLILTR